MFRLASNKPSSSVKVNHDDVDDSRQQQHHDQRDMQRVPEREQPLERLKVSQPAGGRGVVSTPGNVSGFVQPTRDPWR